MNFTVDLSAKDFYETQKIVYESSKVKWVLLLGGLFIALGLVIDLLTNNLLRVDNLLWVVLTLAFLFYPQTLLRIHSYFSYKKVRNLHVPTEFEFTEKGVEIKNKLETVMTNWGAFYKYFANDRILLLYRTPHLVKIIPRRVVESDKEWSNLIGLVKDRIRKN